MLRVFRYMGLGVALARVVARRRQRVARTYPGESVDQMMATLFLLDGNIAEIPNSRLVR